MHIQYPVSHVNRGTVSIVSKIRHWIRTNAVSSCGLVMSGTAVVVVVSVDAVPVVVGGASFVGVGDDPEAFKGDEDGILSG
jgi:hypothetical protein